MKRQPKQLKSEKSNTISGLLSEKAMPEKAVSEKAGIGTVSSPVQQQELWYWQQLLGAVSDAVIGLDLQATITYLNRAAQTLFCCTEAALIGKSFWDNIQLTRPGQTQALSLILMPAFGARHRIRLGGAWRLERQDGCCLEVECDFFPVLNTEGQQVARYLLLRDRTESNLWSRQIQMAAIQDALTGLISRSEFTVRLQQAVQMAHDQGQRHVLCYMDLDQFRVVNDTAGHAVGDALLQQVAQQLRSVVRNRDVLAQLGGDEFAILLWECPDEAGERVVRQIREALNRIRITWQDQRFQVTASVGLVVVDQQTHSAGEVLAMADSACYLAKEHGRNRVHFGGVQDQMLRQRQDEMLWSGRIAEALERRALRLFFQEIAPLQRPADRRHYEILLRLSGEDGQLHAPGVFLPAAEKYGWMQKIDNWVIEQTLRWLDAHPEQQDCLELCTINLSGASINDPGILAFIVECFQRYRVMPQKIGFEVTETVAINRLCQAQALIQGLKDLGCATLLDDFGAGMSSLTYLRNLPVDFLKIDGSFVRNMAQDATDFALIKAINEIGHVTGKHTVAECCEDQTTLALLRNLGVDYVQGYCLARPTALELLLEQEKPLIFS